MTDVRVPVPEPPPCPEPRGLLGERTTLEGWLEFHRAMLLARCAGLDGEQLAMRASPPSTLSLLGLVRHLTDVERGWFLRRWATDFSPLHWSGDNPDGAFDDADPGRARQDVATYLSAVEVCRGEASRHDLDEVVPRRPEDADSELIDVRWIFLHMIEEYARHNGHADLLRQAIDGTTGW